MRLARLNYFTTHKHFEQGVISGWATNGRSPKRWPRAQSRDPGGSGKSYLKDYAPGSFGFARDDNTNVRDAGATAGFHAQFR